MAHIKIGQGFAIIYGGNRDIRWIKGQEFDSLMGGFSPGGGSLDAVAAIAKITQCAALFLQWWEMRRQTLLQSAQFEERRLLWMADILAVWHSELQEGLLRMDTVVYMDREISRFLKKAQGNDLIDAPSSFLLQVERSTNLLVAINTLLNSLIQEHSPNFVLPGSPLPQPFQYKPYFALPIEGHQLEEYTSRSTQFIGALTTLLEVALAPALPNSALWTGPKLAEWRSKLAKREDRLQEFTALQNFAVELRSTHVLLRLGLKTPPTIKVYSDEDIEAGRPGTSMPDGGSIRLDRTGRGAYSSAET